ncbi:hypothetical protein K432DRAFT_294384 [Lepidopterella palustris CBS 459.81]|uniref:Uncharacterized protein n=1 Tax=Lepidopterella palustris CBS 459.81 TaxID=1314670 RepID=A0A8E2EDB6_9PEZI|nr:hypothetical protein K432DRAFT_294384 [Lepidopterella palustris CBS 459.81]
MIILVALVLIGVAVGVGVAVGTKKHGGSSTSLAAESATAGLSNNPSLSFTGTPTSSIQSSSSTSSPTSTSLSVLSAVYGASDVTDTAKSILPQKENIFIPTEPTLPFPDSWFGYRKCLALLLRYGSVDNQDLRTFIACEGTGNYTLVPGNVSLSPNTEATTNLGPSTSTFHIISVIWGPTEIRDSNIYQKLFDCASKSQAVSFSNEFFGQDTWNGTAKSAAVFYTTDNFSTVKNIFGREGQNASFSLL